jgi:hypothetical protein
LPTEKKGEKNMKKLINNIVLRTIALFILFCLAAANLFAQNPCDDQSPEGKAICTTAKSMFRSASVFVTGIDPNEAKIYGWIYIAVTQPDWKTKINEGLKFSEAVGFLKGLMANDGGFLGIYNSITTPILTAVPSDRITTIKTAFQEVYGRAATPNEEKILVEQIIKQKAWYSTIVFDEIKRINNNRDLRIPIIQRAYTEAMGRMPTAGDASYWKPLNEHYRLLIQACRAWLWSNGAEDLRQTIIRALQVKYKISSPSEDQIKNARIKYINTKAIYSEM